VNPPLITIYQISGLRLALVELGLCLRFVVVNGWLAFCMRP
jgi:hypothetical protein